MLAKLKKEFLCPLGLTVPSRAESIKKTIIVILSIVVTSSFVASVDSLTAFIASKF